jgi:tetratricopeptide (TPR) repeat protein
MQRIMKQISGPVQFFGLIVSAISLSATSAIGQPLPPSTPPSPAQTALDPRFVPAHYNLGLALRQKGDIQGAASAFYRTIQVKPDWALAYANLGAALLEGGNLPQAQEYLERAIVLDPQSAISYYNLGLVYQQQRQPSQARPALTTAKQLYDRQNNPTGAARAQKWLNQLPPT